MKTIFSMSACLGGVIGIGATAYLLATYAHSLRLYALIAVCWLMVLAMVVGAIVERDNEHG